MTLLLGENLVLDPLTPEEWNSLRYTPEEWCHNNSMTLRWPHSESHRGYLIVLPGECYAIGVLHINDDYEIRFAIHEEFRDKGYAKEAVKTWAETHLTMGRGTIYAQTTEGDKAANKVLLYAGFVPVEKTPEGTVKWEITP